MPIITISVHCTVVDFDFQYQSNPPAVTFTISTLEYQFINQLTKTGLNKHYFQLLTGMHSCLTQIYSQAGKVASNKVIRKCGISPHWYR